MSANPRPRHDNQPRINFHPNARHTLGVELEVWLIDPETGQLTPRSEELFAICPEPDFYKKELFQSIIEVNTGVCDTVAQVRQDMGAKLAWLQQAGQELGLEFFCAGTHPTSLWSQCPISQDERYHHLVRQMALPARQLLICGLHVHVGVPSGEHAIALVKALSTFIPHLLALSASSPYWLGEDSGLASSRIKIFEGLPTAGLPPRLENWRQFTTLMRTLLSAQAIQSVREIWWDIRPHPGFGTVEVRICDGVNTLEEVCAIAALVQCLASWLCQRYDEGEELPELKHWTLRENKWRAARYGHEAQLVRNEKGDCVPLRDHILEWVKELEPLAAELQCSKELADVPRVLERGPSSWRQRALMGRERSFRSLLDSLVHEFRTGEFL